MFKRKRKIGIVLIALLSVFMLFAFTGCDEAGGDEVEEEPQAENVYNDGVYEGYSDANERGFGHVEVTIEDDEIVDVKLSEFRGTGVEKDDTYSYEEYHEAKELLTELFIESNSPEVDVFTGATSSSEQWMQAMDRALQRALVERTEDTEHFSGTFFGASELGERGRSIAFVTIENDRIVEVILHDTQFNNEGVEEYKTEEYGYEEYHEARLDMSEQFVDNNSTDVDVYSGATSSSEKWIIAVENALEKSEK